MLESGKCRRSQAGLNTRSFFVRVARCLEKSFRKGKHVRQVHPRVAPMQMYRISCIVAMSNTGVRLLIPKSALRLIICRIELHPVDPSCLEMEVGLGHGTFWQAAGWSPVLGSIRISSTVKLHTISSCRMSLATEADKPLFMLNRGRHYMAA